MLTHDSPIGALTLGADETGLTICQFGAADDVAQRLRLDPVEGAAVRWLDLARRELDAYFAGELREFTVPVDLRLAAPFDRAVLAGLASVGYGATTTYGRLAESVGLPVSASRAVGRVMGLNPVAVVVPCHRVVGADGSLVGYGGSLPVKRWLLDLETAERTPRLDPSW